MSKKYNSKCKSDKEISQEFTAINKLTWEEKLQLIRDISTVALKGESCQGCTMRILWGVLITEQESNPDLTLEQYEILAIEEENQMVEAAIEKMDGNTNCLTSILNSKLDNND